MTKQDTMTYAAILTAGMISHDTRHHIDAPEAARIMSNVVHALEQQFPELKPSLITNSRP